jgi:filamentous hemagglutinin family protein
MPTRLPTRLAIAIACALGTGTPWANPNGATVVSGQAGIAASGKTLTVTSTPGTIIHWQGFSIGADELTRFVQQSSRSSVLNRVTGQDPSLLLGRLQSNGRVFLINPNGIAFGAGSRVDVGGLVASTLDLADADFLADRLRFHGTAGAGSLTQLGTIATAAGGRVVLIAPRVENGGVVAAPGGAIVLAAGQSVQLADAATPELRVTVGGRPGEVVNVGELVAAGGRIGIHAGLVRHDGAISADRAEHGPGGEVILRGSEIVLGARSSTSASGAQAGRIAVDAGDGSVSAAGRLLATATEGAGGSVHVLGRHVLLPAAAVDASGAVGGGEILVGGDARGGNAAIRNAETSSVGAATNLRADAGSVGGGGRIVVWADGDTRFAGSASARGGASGGDGGQVEVSGRKTLDFHGMVDTTAARGRTGTLLLDPTNITISGAANASVSAGPTFTGTAATSNLNVMTLQTALASNNVVVDTTSGFASDGNISVNNAVTWSSAHSLELRAHNHITVGAGIAATGTGALRLIANQDNAGGGNVQLNAPLSARTGGIAISAVNVTGAAAGTLTATGGANQNGGAITIAATGAVSLAGAVTTSGGAAGASNPGRDAGAVTIGGAGIATAAINAIGSNGNGSGFAGGNGGNVALVSSGALTTGAISTVGGNGVAGNAAGGHAGTIHLDAGGATPLITLNGNLNAGGGNRAGSAAAGSGAQVWLKDAVALNAASVTVQANGGNTSVGVGGEVRFDGSIDSSGGARALTVNSNAGTVLGGAVGAAAPLLSLTTNAGGSTRIDGGAITTTTGQAFNDAVVLGAHTTLNGGSGALTFASTIDGSFRLDATSTGNATFSGAVGGSTPLDSLKVAGRVVTLGSGVAVDDPGGLGIDLLASQNIAAANGTVTSNGAPITLVANPTGMTAGNYRGIRLTNSTFDAGTGNITMTGTGGTTLTNNMGVQIVDSSLRATGNGRITLNGTGGVSGRGVSVTGSTAAHTVTTVDGDITFTGTGAGSAANTLSADVTWFGVDESTLRAAGSGTVRLVGLGTGDHNGVTLGPGTTPFDYYGAALNRWQVSTASNLVYTGVGIAKSSGGDSTWTITAPKSVEFNSAAGINATSGKLNVVIAPATGAVLLGTGSFRTNGGNLTIGGGSNPGGLVDGSLPATGARGTSTYLSGINSSADIDAGGGNVWMMGSGYTGAPSFNYGINIGSTFVTSNVVTSGAGHITLTGFGGGMGAGSDNGGVFLGQGTVRTGATGSIRVAGTGGNTATGSRNMGVRLFVYNTTEAQGSGAITIWGRSGDGSTAGYNPGIDAAATVAGGGGPVTLTGIAGNAPGSNNLGISAIGKVTNTGAGSVTLIGTGGSHAGASSSNNFGIGFSDAQFTTVDGDLTVIGTGGSGGGAGNHGLVFPMAGIGGYGGTSTIRSSGTGNVSMTGMAGPGGTGIVQSIPNLVSTTGTGRITLAADSLALNAANAVSSASDLAIRPVTSGTALAVGSAAGSSGLALDDAELARLAWGAGGTLTLGAANAGPTTVHTGHVFDRPVAIVSGAGADLVLAGTLASTSAAAAPAIVLDAGRNFVNTAGANALDAGSGRWLVYSSDPRADTRGGLAADFTQYAAAFGTTPVLGSGDGFLHRLAPTLTPVLGGTVSKVYDGGTAAVLAASQLAAAGAIDGDSVVLAAPATAAFDTRHVGDGKTVTAGGIAIAGASRGGSPVYGYTLATTTASADMGTVTPASLVVRPDDQSRPQGQPGPLLTASFLGLVGGESASVLGGALVLDTAATTLSPPGLYRIGATGLTSSNYRIAYVDGVYEVLPPVFTRGLFGPGLTQRDLRLAPAPGAAAACPRHELDGWVAAHGLPALFAAEPACRPERPAGSTR